MIRLLIRALKTVEVLRLIKLVQKQVSIASHFIYIHEFLVWGFIWQQNNFKIL